jgi:phage tail protein X
MTWQLPSNRPSGLTWQQGIIGALLLGAIGFGGWQLVEHHQQEQQYRALLENIEALKSAQDYSACQEQASKIPTHSGSYAQAKNRLRECAAIQAAFNQASKLAEAGQFAQAMAIVVEIADPTATTQVNQLVNLWSEQTLQTAQQIFEDRNGRMPEALEKARSIPADNPWHQQAQAKIQAWTDQWSRNEACWKAAESALYARQFDLALTQIQQIDHPYWDQQAIPIASAISLYTSLLPVLTQPSSPPVQPDPSDLSRDGILTQTPQPSPPDTRDLNPYGESLSEPETDMTSLTLKFLIPLSVPLMLGLGRSRS